MSLLKDLATDDSIANEKDSVGGNAALESGVYPATITLAYVTKSAGGATGLVIQAKTDSGRDIKQTLWMTSGTAKGAKNFYEKDGVKNYLPGFIAASSLTLLTVGKEISAMDTETKVVNVYSKEAKAEVPTKVEMLTDLLGKAIIIGLIKQTVDKTAKGEGGAYLPTGETREENEIDKFFRASDKMTTAEIRASASEPAFYTTWATKWNGNTRDKASKATGTAGVPRAAGAAVAGTKKPATSLFA
jgi:hypothetical protein